MSCYSTFWPNPSKDQGPKSPAAMDEGLSQAPGISAASWAQESGLQEKGQPGEPTQPVPETGGRRRSLSCASALLSVVVRPGRHWDPGGAGCQFTVGTWL